MRIYFPSALWNSYAALPIELNVQGFILLVFVWDNCLFIVSAQKISARVMPCACLIRFVVGELSFVVSSVGEDPSAFLNGVLFPLTYQFHAALTVCVSALALFSTEKPPAWIGVFVSICVSSFPMFDTIFPLA